MSDIKKAALISSCGLYRYDLLRQWGEDNKFVMFVGLNPSTADDEIDDATMRRLISFADLWGYKKLAMTNLFAYRATNPLDMMQAQDPVGPENNKTILGYADQADLIVLCWGANGCYLRRDYDVLKLLKKYEHKIRCFGLTKNASTRHPLYLPKTTQLTKY